ncbi:unnamed protein product [Staurois parvus]|uniref:IRS-type PTB domain-containing protein n=1 Tax=Staurois parvus TaxID=386267 RepID=A0ABN9AP99_9NEOB|nr:unnamed protein product [Staurois parvus]
MGSCCSCPDKEAFADNQQNRFKVINVDDDGNELGSGVMELTENELILYTRKRDSVKWPYLCLRRYGYDSNLFSFESGRRCQTGQGIFAFKCARAEELFNMLQEIMQNNSISVVEEPVVERSPQTELDVPRTPRTPTTPAFSGSSIPNGYPRYPSFGDASSHPSSRHPSVGSTRLPSLWERSLRTHCLLLKIMCIRMLTQLGCKKIKGKVYRHHLSNVCQTLKEVQPKLSPVPSQRETPKLSWNLKE